MNTPLRIREWILSVAAIAAGVILVSIGLEMFLTPHKIIPGGVKGVAVLLSHVTEMRMGLVLLLINLPFAWFRPAQKTRMLSALVTLVIVASLAMFLHPFPPLFESPLPAALFGGATLGLGVGLIVRFGWYADGIHVVASYMKKKIALSIGEVVMIMNICILALGGFLFGWDQALYSVIAYFVAYRIIQWTLQYRSKSMVWIHSAKRELLLNRIDAQFASDIEVLERSSLAPSNSRDLYLSVPGRTLASLKQAVSDIDPAAQMTISPLSSPEAAYYKL